MLGPTLHKGSGQSWTKAFFGHPSDTSRAPADLVPSSIGGDMPRWSMGNSADSPFRVHQVEDWVIEKGELLVL